MPRTSRILTRGTHIFRINLPNLQPIELCNDNETESNANSTGYKGFSIGIPPFSSRCDVPTLKFCKTGIAEPINPMTEIETRTNLLRDGDLKKSVTSKIPAGIKIGKAAGNQL